MKIRDKIALLLEADPTVSIDAMFEEGESLGTFDMRMMQRLMIEVCKYIDKLESKVK